MEFEVPIHAVRKVSVSNRDALRLVNSSLYYQKRIDEIKQKIENTEWNKKNRHKCMWGGWRKNAFDGNSKLNSVDPKQLLKEAEEEYEAWLNSDSTLEVSWQVR